MVACVLPGVFTVVLQWSVMMLRSVDGNLSDTK